MLDSAQGGFGVMSFSQVEGPQSRLGGVAQRLRLRPAILYSLYYIS